MPVTFVFQIVSKFFHLYRQLVLPVHQANIISVVGRDEGKYSSRGVTAPWGDAHDTFLRIK
jgi:hypothetical protein